MSLPEREPASNRKKKLQSSQNYRSAFADSGRTVTGKRKESKWDRESLRPRDQRQGFAKSRSQLRKRVIAAGGVKAYHLSIIRRGGRGKPFLPSVSFHLSFHSLNHCPVASPQHLGEWQESERRELGCPLSQRAVSPTDKWENTAVTALTNGATFCSENKRVL